MPEAEQRFQRRQTAYKIRIKDILNSRYVKREGFAPNYLETYGQEISRINVVGVVVQKSELNNYKILMIDDSTGKISARVFEKDILLNNVDVGDMVLIIGRPREFSSEKYLLIETIKKINPKWAKVRQLELEKTRIVEKSQIDSDSAKNKEFDISPANKIVRLLKDSDKGNGVSIEEISSKDIKGVDKLIEMLLKEGDIFEIRPGRFKVLE
ncbi:hypothetical protein KY347_01300 [Candidatus Woesearchaeota archaeon]|nr:hypothetical protein [Candidatus Woesearchaeota archaeon]